MRHPNRWLLLLCLPLLGATCQSSITIDSPKDNTVYETVPDFKVTFSGGAPANLTLQLNGNDVKSLFTVSSTGATAPASALAHLLREGDNKFSAKDGASGREITFAKDALGPVVHVRSVSAGNPMQVSGRLVDRAGSQSLSINGQNVTLANGDFTANVSDAPTFQFVAKDGMNHVSTTTYARAGTVLATSAAARLNKTGLAFLVQELNVYLGTLDYVNLIKSLNPLFDEGDWWASARVDATNVTLTAPRLTMAVSPSAERSFDIRVEIPTLKVFVHAAGTIIGIGWSANGNVSADLAVFTGRATVNINDAKLDVSLSNLACTLQGFKFDISGFPDELESWFYDDVKGLLEGVVRDEMAARIPPYIEEFLQNIPSEFEFVLMGARFSFAALPASLKTALEGLSVQLGGWLDTLSPLPTVPRAIGSLFVSAAAPELGQTTPGGTPIDAAAAISTNLAHQALLSAYRAGLLNLTLDGNRLRDLSTRGLADVAPELGDEAADNDLRFQIIPSGPPTIALEGSATALAHLRLDEFDFRLEIFRDAQWKLAFGAHLDMDVPFDVGVTNDNKLQVSFEEVPAVKVWTVDDGGIIDIDPEFVQATLDRLLPRALPYLAGIIEEIPIPSYAGYGILVKGIWPVGAEKGFLGIGGNLIKTTLTDAAAEPDTFVALDATNYHSEGFFLELTAPGTLRGKELVVPLSGSDPEAAGLEYSYRLDGGPWTVWKVRSEIRLHSLMSGRHTLEVRSRSALLKEDTTPARIDFAVGLASQPVGVASVPAP